MNKQLKKRIDLAKQYANSLNISEGYISYEPFFDPVTVSFVPRIFVSEQRFKKLFDKWEVVEQDSYYKLYRTVQGVEVVCLIRKSSST